MEYELQHHGIKGMKWGVRRYQNADGTLTAAGRRRNDREKSKKFTEIARKEDPSIVRVKAKTMDDGMTKLTMYKKVDRTHNWSDDAKSAHDLKKKSVNEMSNKELKQINERIRLEQEYARLNPSTVSKGKKLAGDILANAAKESAKNFVSKQIGKGFTKGGEVAVSYFKNRR